MWYRLPPALVRAFVISMLAHGVLLVGVTRLLPQQIDLAAAPQRVAVRLYGTGAAKPMSRESPMTAATAVQPVLAVPGKGRTAVQERIPGKSDVLRSSTAEAHDSESPGLATPARPAERAEVGVVTSESAAAPDVGSVRRQTPEGPSADDLRQYRLSLGLGARRYKRYPALARENGWEGRVEVAVEFRRLLPEPRVSLATSSGHRTLDEQALEMIRLAARQTELPPRLKERDFRLVQEVVFSLERED